MNNRKHLNKEKSRRSESEIKSDMLIVLGAFSLLVTIALIGVLAGIPLPCSL